VSLEPRYPDPLPNRVGTRSQMKAFDRKLPRIVESLPRSFVEHYVRPALIRQPRAPFDAKSYFESKYSAILEREFSDRVMIWPDFDPLWARHHYNSVENGIIEYFVTEPPRVQPKILDIGCGAGHWVDFFRELFDPSLVVGMELSRRCANELRRKYADEPRVVVVEDDVSRAELSLDQSFDVIVAVGVMFHIVVDEAWERAVANLARHLNEGGTVVVGGQFGLTTRDVNFTSLAQFNSWEEAVEADAEVAFVRKRIRSLRRWRQCARQNGLRISRVQRTRRYRRIAAPENNLLFLTPR
jgi:SAM-dependent methyltransferase